MKKGDEIYVFLDNVNYMEDPDTGELYFFYYAKVEEGIAGYINSMDWAWGYMNSSGEISGDEDMDFFAGIQIIPEWSVGAQIDAFVERPVLLLAMKDKSAHIYELGTGFNEDTNVFKFVQPDNIYLEDKNKDGSYEFIITGSTSGGAYATGFGYDGNIIVWLNQEAEKIFRYHYCFDTGQELDRSRIWEEPELIENQDGFCDTIILTSNIEDLSYDYDDMDGSGEISYRRYITTYQWDGEKYEQTDSEEVSSNSDFVQYCK